MNRANIQDGRMIEVLQNAVNTELTVSQHYWGRSIYWDNLNIPKLKEMYAKEADEERGHAKLVADRMTFLGVSPEIAPSMDRATQGSLKQQFMEDLQGEITVANQYTTWVQESLEKRDFVTMKILQLILEQTEEHVNYLQGELDKIDLMGEPLYLESWM